jgi:hypothetical protein
MNDSTSFGNGASGREGGSQPKIRLVEIVMMRLTTGAAPIPAARGSAGAKQWPFNPSS